jgi:predicted  nucleic acid-binding Zn-ribbon protein
MDSQFRLLHDLMKLDRTYFSLQAQLRDIPPELEQMGQEEDLLGRTLLVEEARLTECQRERRQMETIIQDRQSERRRFESQIYEIREPRQLQSLQREIEYLRQTVSELEEKVLANMQQEEELEQRIKRQRQDVADRQRELAERRRRLTARQAESAASVEKMEVERRKLLDELRPSIRSKYLRIVNAKGQEGIVSVTDRSCGGCFYKLPPQTVAEVRLGQRLVLCEGCGRILVWSNDSGR